MTYTEAKWDLIQKEDWTKEANPGSQMGQSSKQRFGIGKNQATSKSRWASLGESGQG